MEEVYEHRHLANGGPHEEVGIRPVPGPSEGRPQPAVADRRAARRQAFCCGSVSPTSSVRTAWAGARSRTCSPPCGDAVFANLPLLFCVGIAIGFAKKADGSTALAALVGFLVYKNVLTAFPISDAKVTEGADVAATYNDPKVFGGIIMGLIAAVTWQRFHRTKLPDWLGFFNGPCGWYRS